MLNFLIAQMTKINKSNIKNHILNLSTKEKHLKRHTVMAKILTKKNIKKDNKN